MNNFFSKPYFQEWINRASPEIKEWFLKEAEYLKHNIKPNSVVLEVGCGYGRQMKKLVKSAKRVVGIDNDVTMVKKARKNMAKFKNAKILFQDAKKMDFADNNFDYVLCLNNTFGNFSGSKRVILKEMKRVCKIGGRIIISVYSENAFVVRKKNYEKIGLHIKKIENNTIYTKEGLISEQFTKDRLIKIFKEANMDVNIKNLNSISYICSAKK
jgi:ubiquinone/menaquinone biosynthesis C-methylase UbiE